ncbi:unnamed protein product [Closterium sp. NIES-53]
MSGGSERCPYVIRTGVLAGQTCGKLHTQHRCFSRLDDAWPAEFGDDVERPRWANLLRSGVVIFDIDYDAILYAMYALFASAEGDCYRCVPPDPSMAAAALGASESGTLPGTAPAQALHTFTLDSGASCYFFRDSTTLTPLPAHVPVRLADPSGGPVVAHSSTVLSCPAVPSGSLSGLHLPSFSKNFMSTAALQDAMVTTTTPGGSSLYTLATKPPQTLLWHHHLGHPSLPRLRGMHSRLLGRERYILLVVNDYTRYTAVFPLRSKGEVSNVLIPWIRTVRLQLRERFRQDQPVLRLHSDRGAPHWLSHGGSLYLHDPCGCSPFSVAVCGPVGDASVFWVWGSRAFVRDTSADKLSARAIPFVFLGFVPDAPGWQFYHPTSRRIFPSQDITFDESVPFYLVGSGAALGAASEGAELWGADSEGAGSGGAEPPGVETRGVEPGGAESEGAESGGAEPRGAALSGGPAGASPLLTPQQLPGGARVTAGAGGTGGTAAAGPRGARSRGAGAAGTGGVGSTGAGDPTEPGAAGAGGSCAGGAGAGGARVGGTGAGGAAAAGAGAVHPSAGGAGGTVRPRQYFVPQIQQVLGVPSSTSLTPPLLCPSPNQSQPPFVSASPLPAPSPYTEQSNGLTERREPVSCPVSPVRTARRVPRLRPPPVPSTHAMAIRPSSVPLRVPLPPPPESSLPEVPDPESDHARAASPSVSRLLAIAVTDPSFESAAASALVAELLDFAAACRLDYATALVAESASATPPSIGGECALGTDILEDKQEDFECLVASVPRFASMLLAPKGDPDAPDIPTPRSYAEAITGPYSSQWQAAMDAEMASWKSTGTYVDEVPPPGVNIVDGMWIFRVKRPPGFPPAFKARYVAQGFDQRQGVDYFHNFSPIPKMTTLRVLLHVAAQRDYEMHSLDFSTPFLQGSLHEEIWLRRQPGFTGSFPAGTQWSLRRPVYGLRQAPRKWHDILRTTLAALGFAPSTADPSLFLRTDTSLPPFYVLIYVDNLIFATADTEALTLVKSELQKRHTCTDLGELRSSLGLQITRDRARCTITLTQSHMVHQVLQRFSFRFSSPQPTPLSTSHSLLAPPSDESVEPSGPFLELVGCLITSGMGLVLGGRGPVVLTGHADASWVDDSTTQWLSQGYTFSLGSGSVSCRSLRSSLVLSSSCEAEIYAGAMAAQELRWLTYLLTDLGEQPRSPPVLYVDNKAMIALCQEHRLEHRTKHIALRYFLARELQQRGQLRLAYVATRANTADVFTKALPPCDHQRFSTVLGLVPTLPHLLTA